MAAETFPYQNGVVAKKSKENDRRRRRGKAKKNNKASEQPASNIGEDSDNAKENTDPKQVSILLTFVTIAHMLEFLLIFCPCKLLTDVM